MSPYTDRRMPPRQNPGQGNGISRMEEKRQLRRRRQKRRRIALVVLMAVLCVFSFILGRVTAPKAEQNGEKGGGVQGAAESAGAAKEEPSSQPAAEEPETEEEAVSATDMRLYVLAHPEEYPSYLQEFMETTPEALEFVYQYPEYKNLHQTVDISGECRKGEVPLFIQWDKRWGYESYGDDLIALSGCGPVCLSMVYVGLTGDTSMDPKAMSEFSMENGFYLENVGTSWELMSSGAELLGLSWENISLHENEFYEYLDMGCPLICSMRPGDFTSTGHFIVIYGRNGEELLVHDPNSPERSAQTWTYDELEDQIKNIWAYSA